MLISLLCRCIDMCMKRQRILSLSKEQWVDIERQLQYIDFISRREFSPTSCGDNVLALFDAIMLLSGAGYTQEQLHAMLLHDDDNSSQARFVRCYYNFLERYLLHGVDVAIDEAYIVELYSALYENTPVEAVKPSRRVLSVAPVRSRVLADKPATVSVALSEMVEWLMLHRPQDCALSIVDIAVFLHRLVNARVFSQGAEELMHLLMLPLLYDAGCGWVKHMTPAQVMAHDCLAYRRALHADEAHWVVYFVASVYNASRLVSERFAPSMPPVSASHKTVLNPRQRAILDYIGAHQPVGLSAIVTHLHKESVNTIKKDLRHLRTLGFITADGVLKGTVYYKN